MDFGDEQSAEVAAGLGEILREIEFVFVRVRPCAGFSRGESHGTVTCRWDVAREKIACHKPVTTEERIGDAEQARREKGAVDLDGDGKALDSGEIQGVWRVKTLRRGSFLV